MTNDESLEEMLIIMEKEKNLNHIQVRVFVEMLTNYEGNRFDEFYNRFRKLEYQ